MMPCPHKLLLLSATAMFIATGTATAQTAAPGTAVVRCWDSLTRQIRTKVAQDVQSSLLSTGARSFAGDRPTAALGLPECLLVR